MNNQDITQFLQKLDLGPKEIRAYLYGLQTGPLTVSILANRIAVSRTNGYNIVDSLSQKGLCRNLGSEYGRKVEMLHPRELNNLIQQKVQDAQSMESELQTLLPHLEKQLSKSKISIPAKISYVEGVDGLRQLFERILQSDTKLLRKALGTKDVMESLGKAYVTDWVQRRVKKGMSVNVLREYQKTPNGGASDKNLKRQSRMLPKEIEMPAGMLILDDAVVHFTTNDEIFGTMIEGTEIATSMRSWFDYLFGISKKF